MYHSACLERGQSYWDYENFQLSSVDWEDPDGYEVTGRLGFGRFSEVSLSRQVRKMAKNWLVKIIQRFTLECTVKKKTYISRQL